MHHHGIRVHDAMGITKTTRNISKKVDIEQNMIPLQTANHESAEDRSMFLLLKVKCVKIHHTSISFLSQSRVEQHEEMNTQL